MHLTATIANALWSASNLPGYLRFRRALREPQAAQEKILRGHLERNAHAAFGKAHRGATIRSYAEFARRVPLADYDSFEPWITRIRQGETNVLTREPVTCLIPTSGSSGARKLIPFTAGFQREFNAALGPWLVDLQRQAPGLMGGPAYWSVTPALTNLRPEESVVPIGFDSDAAYLGGTRRRLAEAAMAVPSSVQRAESLESFRYETLLYLLRCRELRLISVWHPSFLALLLEALPFHWENLLSDIERGRGQSPAPLPRRADELRTANPQEPAMLWPELRVISCWGDGNAGLAISDLRRRFPDAHVQRKGLLATEAVVTIPFSGFQPLAVRSHFFEFVDDKNRVHLAHQLRENEVYEIVVTTGGGLWRYRLQDQVRVTGFLEKTPTLQFLGRIGGISDRFGEKLHEAFVAQAIHEAITDRSSLPRFVLLAPDEDQSGCRYTLYVEGEIQNELVARLDGLLTRNPHYAWCRALGQLRPPRLFRIQTGGYESFLRRESVRGGRLGEVKPSSLSALTGWSEYFEGQYSSGELCELSPTNPSRVNQQSGPGSRPGDQPAQANWSDSR